MWEVESFLRLVLCELRYYYVMGEPRVQKFSFSVEFFLVYIIWNGENILENEMSSVYIHRDKTQTQEGE